MKKYSTIGLVILLLVIILLFRPQGLFGRLEGRKQ